MKIVSGEDPPMKRKTPRKKPAPPHSPKPLRDAPAERLAKTPFLIVGIGASAGGLEAFSQLLRALPADTGMAFVLVQHLDP